MTPVPRLSLPARWPGRSPPPRPGNDSGSGVSAADQGPAAAGHRPPEQRKYPPRGPGPRPRGPGTLPLPMPLTLRAPGDPPGAHHSPRAAAIPASRPPGRDPGHVGQPGGARYVRPRLPCGLGVGSRRELRPELFLPSRSSSTTPAAPDGAYPPRPSPETQDPPGSPPGAGEGREKGYGATGVRS